MSKKTNAAKLQARTLKRPRKNAHKRGRKNPAFGMPPEQFRPPHLFGDPIFLHHVASAIFRALEVNDMLPKFPPESIDAEFVNPSDVDKPKSEVQ